MSGFEAEIAVFVLMDNFLIQLDNGNALPLILLILTTQYIEYIEKRVGLTGMVLKLFHSFSGHPERHSE